MGLDTILSVSDASVHQNGHLVLSDVTLRIDTGEFVYLIGRTGSGKSSLLRTLYCDLPLKSGDVQVAGYSLRDIRKKDIPHLRRKLGIVFQDYQLLTDRTVNDNLHFVMRATGWKNKAKMRERAEAVLDKVGLGTKGFKMPHQLSGGEQQRIAIARALVNDPHVILADEPTGNLDPETSEGILKLLFDISKAGRAVVMATHDFPMIVKFPARILKCEEGKVVSS